MPDNAEHRPVLLEEVLAGLKLAPEGDNQGGYLDATWGRGGHARAMLAVLSERGRVLALDRDPQAVRQAQQSAAEDSRLTVVQGAFSEMAKLIAESGFQQRSFAGVLFDLGVSSPQLDEPARGFSFRADGPLDMRMDPERGEPAQVFVNRASEQELAGVIGRLGEERFARRIARAIVAQRRAAPIDSTSALAALVAGAVATREPGKHPATRTFQALRMHVNDELGELEKALPQAVDALAPGGRLCVISFHSLEDRMVKRYLRRLTRDDDLPPEVAVAHGPGPRLRLCGRPRRASVAEVERNPRSRSAVLRVAERTDVD
ncbi:MAG: 16S rRNA (cytosine(1402)-N(4))-methyltransferase RsmH [Gammaproteobacteria bacterium]|nr:16S rRNA (cytosine(1402)-N(4))-methyltransferase RsmH [Gammaproteobacteria bacterium]